jgi:hypothetical protein
VAFLEIPFTTVTCVMSITQRQQYLCYFEEEREYFDRLVFVAQGVQYQLL